MAHDINTIFDIPTTWTPTLTHIHIICILFLYTRLRHSHSYSRRIKSTLHICNNIPNFSPQFSPTNLDFRTTERSNTHLHPLSSSHLLIWIGNLHHWLARTTKKIDFILPNGSIMLSSWSLIRCIFMKFFFNLYLLWNLFKFDKLFPPSLIPSN